MQLVMKLDRDELSRLPFPVIVESWSKVKETGRRKRAWLDTFTESERKYLSAMYKKFYRWYLVSGVPKHFLFKDPSKIDLINRAGNFFAAI